MGLSSALASAMSGLRANQAALSIVSSNVANSQTPGYVVQTPNQIEVTTGDFGSTATDDRRQPGARHLCAEPAAHRDRRRRLRRPDGQHPEAASECLWHARQQRHARNRAEQFHHGAAGAVDQRGLVVGANGCARRRAGAGAAAQRHHQGHPVAALQRRAGSRHLGAAGQRGDAAGRATSTPSCRACRQTTPRPRR